MAAQANKYTFQLVLNATACVPLLKFTLTMSMFSFIFLFLCQCFLKDTEDLSYLF